MINASTKFAQSALMSARSCARFAITMVTMSRVAYGNVTVAGLPLHVCRAVQFEYCRKRLVWWHFTINFGPRMACSMLC